MHYYQFNIGDYISHTLHLDIYEDLAYRRLIDKYFLDEKPIEGDIKTIAKKIRLPEHENSVELVLSEFFIEKNGKYHQKRIDLALKSYKDYLKKQSLNGKKGGRPKKNPPLNDGKATDNPNESQKKPKQEPLNTNNKTNIKEVASAPDFNFKNSLLAMGVSEETSTEWLKIRKTKKAIDSERAFNLLVTEVSKSDMSFPECIELAANKQWKGFEAHWINKDTGDNNASAFD